jgi:hypothetical protein
MPLSTTGVTDAPPSKKAKSTGKSSFRYRLMNG